ncbi:MAG: glycosyltransferase [Acidaminococcaceae bacterium]|nr:glycosyltransferase [Acidaminococcaceae bacterium]
MKISLFGMSYYNYTKSIKYALEALGHEVLMVIDDDLGFRSKNIVANKLRMINFQPDLFINFCGNYRYNLIDADFLNKITGKKILMYADAIKFVGNVEQNISLYDKVCLFEETDVKYIKSKYGVNCDVISGSVAEEIFCLGFPNQKRVYDLSFVGVMLQERLDFFEKIAQYAIDKKLNMIVYGNFWKKKHWWQELWYKRKFFMKYPNLAHFAVNDYIQPEQASLLYRKTKICLNKHIDRHKSVNYRVFEIMANNNFELCDSREQANEFGLKDSENIAFYEDVEDCIKKIEYYLINEEIRQKIAEAGGELVRKKFTTKAVMERLLTSL